MYRLEVIYPHLRIQVIIMIILISKNLPSIRSITLFNESSFLSLHSGDELVDAAYNSTHTHIYIEREYFLFGTRSIFSFVNEMATITDNDKYVLNAIFNPNYPMDFDNETSSDSIDKENESKTRCFSVPVCSH